MKPQVYFTTATADNKPSKSPINLYVMRPCVAWLGIAAIASFSAFSTVLAEGAGTGKTENAASSSESFDVMEIRVLGNSVLPAMQVEKAVYPFLGPKKTLKDIESSRAALEKVYRDTGYNTVYVDIPEQSVEEGIVRLKVTEGKVGQVRVTGTRYFSNRQIVAGIPTLEPGRVPYFPVVQQEISVTNSATRDRQIVPVLKAGREPGTVDVELKVKDELPLHGAIEVNDRYTTDTTKLRANLNLSYDNLWRKFHSLSLQYQTAPEETEEARVIAATYVAPMPDRSVLALYAVDTNSNVSTVGALSVLGKGRIYGARYIDNLPALPESDASNYLHSVTFGGDYKDFSEDVRVSEDSGLQTPIAYANWSVSYGGTWRTEATATSFNLGFNFGIRGLANDAEEFENKRYNANPNYSYLRGDASVELPLLLGTRIGLRAAGQYTTEPLISNEQFSIGGAYSVRGYTESAQLGDYGASGTFELRSPAMFIGNLQSNRFAVSRFYVLGFFDAGVLGVNDPLPQQDSRSSLSSYGLGWRFSGFRGLDAEFDWARVRQASGKTLVGDSRIHFLVRYGF